jgi:hypothetical protein
VPEVLRDKVRKLILPRKDHECYFIPLPEKPVRKKILCEYINKNLKERHPGFSDNSAVDIKKISIDGKKWLLLTVMEKAILTEYKTLHPHTVLFTMTSILANVKNFAGHRDYVSATEIIGYNKETKTPFSLPLAEDEAGSSKRLTSYPSAKKIAWKCSVYKSKHKGLKAATALVVSLAFVLTISFASFASQKEAAAITEPQRNPLVKETEPENLHLPSSLAILADTVAVVLSNGILIKQWQYDESDSVPLLISLRGGEPEKIRGSFLEKDYIGSCFVSEIKYENSIAVYNLSLFFKDKYALPRRQSFTNQELPLSIFAKIRNTILSLKASILAEMPPEDTGDTNYASLSLESPVDSIVQVLNIIERTLNEASCSIALMSLIYSEDKKSFVLNCSWSPGFQTDKRKNENILLAEAFGWKPEPVVTFAVKHTQHVQKLLPEEQGWVKIGRAVNADGSIITYYRNNEGKIVNIEEAGN